MDSVDYDTDLVLITAASNLQAVSLPHFLGRWKRLRLNADSVADMEALEEFYPDAEVVHWDILDRDACTRLLQGVTACYLDTPGFHPDEFKGGRNVIDAAAASFRSGGPFKHFVYSSVLFPILQTVMNHDRKRLIEEYLIESGLPYTILQPANIMEGLNIAALVQQGTPSVKLTILWNPKIKFSFVAARDMGEALDNILAQRKEHFSATYQIVGTRAPLSYIEAADIIGEEIRKEVWMHWMPLQQGAAMMSSMVARADLLDVPWVVRQGVLGMLQYCSRRGLVGNPNVLEMLLGRKPLEYREWVRINAQELLLEADKSSEEPSEGSSEGLSDELSYELSDDSP